MVLRLKKKTDDILLENPLDDVIEVDEEGEKVEVPRKQNYLHFLKNRKYLITLVGGLSFFVLILVIVLCTYSRVSTEVFNAGLIKYLDDNFAELDKVTKDLYVDELTELHRRGLISDDHVYEFSIYKEFHEFNQKYQKTHENLDDKIHRFTNFRDNYIESKIERSMFANETKGR